MENDAIYINRGKNGFEKYAGTLETLAMVGWPSVFPERFKTNQPVSVRSAIRFLRTNEEKQLSLVTMDEPDDKAWEALERYIASAQSP